MTICIRHRDGWCATRRDCVPECDVLVYHTEGAHPSVGLEVGRCGSRSLAYASDYADREPTCAECRERLGLEEAI